MNKHIFYTQHLNIKLLMNLGAHIGHAKIDWNTDNNAYLAGLTNNNYILFNINKTLFFFKRSLTFMHLVGYNNGKFVIYYPGDNPFYKLMMETTLDKEGLVPTKYPFIHSLVKPGFFSNWRVNYKKLVREFFKVIYWNPYFFGGMTTQFLYKNLDKFSLKAYISEYLLNRSKNQSRSIIQATTIPLRIFKRMKRPHFRVFKNLQYIDKRSITSKNYKDQYLEHKFKSIKRKILKETKFNNIERNGHHVNKKRYNIQTLNYGLKVLISKLHTLKKNIFFNQTDKIENFLLACRYYQGLPHFTIYSNRKCNLMCYYSATQYTEKYSFINEQYHNVNNYNYKSNNLDFFIYSIIPSGAKLEQKVIECYYRMRLGKDDVKFRDYLKRHSLNNIVTLVNYIETAKRVKRKIPLIKRTLNRQAKLSNLTRYQKKKWKKLMYFNKLGISNKYIFKQYFNAVSKSNPLNQFSLKNNTDKIHRNMSLIMNKGINNKHLNILNIRRNRVRNESLKMVYYNFYNMLVNIAMRNIKYNNKNDDLTPYEQKYFKRFIKFILIFRYLKRIKSVPSAVLLINSDVHESQYTDFKLLNTAVIGLLDSNIKLDSLSYFIPTNDDNLLLFLYYIKMISHSFSSGRKRSIIENLTPRFANNIVRKLNYSIPFIYQYDKKLSDQYKLLPFGSILDRKHIERLERKRIEKEKREAMYAKWDRQRTKLYLKNKQYQQQQQNQQLTRKDLFELHKILNL